MGKILVFIFDGMTDYEVTFISHLLNSDAGMEVVTVSYEDKIIRGKTGFLYKPLELIENVYIEDIKGIIIPGGWYGDIRPELIELINILNSKGKLIGGICGAGTVILAKAGVLNNVKYTTPVTQWTQKHIEVFGEEDPFPRGNYVSKRVVRDKNIITAQGTAFIDFAIEICDWFNLFENIDEMNDFAKNIKGEILI